MCGFVGACQQDVNKECCSHVTTMYRCCCKLLHCNGGHRFMFVCVIFVHLQELGLDSDIVGMACQAAEILMIMRQVGAALLRHTPEAVCMQPACLTMHC